MATSFRECCEQLAGYGVDPNTACRACEIAYWDAFGMTPEAADNYGVDPGGSIASRAYHSLAELAELAEEEPDSGQRFCGPEIDLPAALKEPIKLEAYSWDSPQEESGMRSLLREVRMLAPGTYTDAKGKKFEFTDSDLQLFAAHFEPGNNPPILIDHEISAKNISGYIRALRYVAGYDATSSELVALWEFLGEEACCKVEQGLWKRVSGQFVVGPSEVDKKILEGSVVVFGAYDRGRGDRAEILKKKDRRYMKMSNPEPTTAPAPVAAPTPPQTAPPAPAPEVAQLAQVTDLSVKLETMQLKLVAMRKREDAADYKLLMSEGFSSPGMEESELAFFALLTDEVKGPYLQLRRKLTKTWEPGGRLSTPDDPEKSTSDDPQGKVFAQLMQAAGLAPETKKEDVK